MLPKIVALLLSAVASIGTWFARGAIEAWFFGKVVAVTPDPISGGIVEYGPPAAFAALTIWLLLRNTDLELPSLTMTAFPWSLVPIDTAARLAFEAAEKAGVADLTTHPDTAPEERLRHFIYGFMVDDQTTLLGAKPPSTRLTQVSDDDGSLYPVVGENRFDALTPRRVAYTNVKIRRRDLNRIIREYPRRAREFARDHGVRR
ncbi:MAG TPA: hypothetical protein VGU20_13955 [Stellaceae bacterium]|nr:hypothetical protein [Stellaceae bacterium]